MSLRQQGLLGWLLPDPIDVAIAAYVAACEADDEGRAAAWAELRAHGATCADYVARSERHLASEVGSTRRNASRLLATFVREARRRRTTVRHWPRSARRARTTRRPPNMRCGRSRTSWKRRAAGPVRAARRRRRRRPCVCSATARFGPQRSRARRARGFRRAARRPGRKSGGARGRRFKRRRGPLRARRRRGRGWRARPALPPAGPGRRARAGRRTLSAGATRARLRASPLHYRPTFPCPSSRRRATRTASQRSGSARRCARR